MSVQRLLDRIAASSAARHRGRSGDLRRRAPDLSPFEFIDTRETRLSHILSWMLDPDGSHGQGDAFLKRFLDLVVPDWSNAPTATARVRREVPTRYLDAKRRLDILVEGEGWALAIENKPYALDQPNQVSDYLRHLNALRRERIALVYLSGDGSDPTEDAISAKEWKRRHEQIRTLGYADLEPWLDACRRTCEAERVSVFVEEFLRFVRTKVRKVTDMSEHEEVLRVVGSSAEMVEAAMQVAAAARTLRVQLLTKLRSDVEKLVDPRWRVDDTFSTTSWLLMSIAIDSTSSMQFAIEFNNASGYFGRMIWGLRSPEGLPDNAAEIREAMNARFGRGRHNDWWVWYREMSSADADLPLEADWETTVAPWVAVARGEVAPLVATAAGEVYETLAARRFIARPRGRPPTRRA